MQSILNVLLSKHHVIILILLIVGLVFGFQSFNHQLTSDLTQNKRNSLSQESITALRDMPEKIEILFYSSNSPTKGKYFRKSFDGFLKRYLQIKNNISISYIDPNTDAKKAAELGLKLEGDMIVQYKNRSEPFSIPYNEDRFTNLLVKLKESKKLTFFFTSGYQEPLLDNADKSGLSKLAKELDSNGYQYTQSDNFELIKQNQILVINAPQKHLSAKDVKQLIKHVEEGSSLIWLLNSANLNGLDDLAKLLNIKVSEGVAVDLSNEIYGIEPTLVNATNYSRHEILSDFSLKTFFLNAHRISEIAETKSQWKTKNLIGVAENGWLTKSNQNSVSKKTLADDIERQGPINIAIALERTHNNKLQRVIVFGNSMFLSNQHINQGGNSQLGIRLANWVSSNYSSISVPVRITKDTIVLIPNETSSKYLILAIFNGFQFVLPAFLMCIALLVWIKKARK